MPERPWLIEFTAEELIIVACSLVAAKNTWELHIKRNQPDPHTEASLRATLAELELLMDRLSEVMGTPRG